MDPLSPRSRLREHEPPSGGHEHDMRYQRMRAGSVPGTLPVPHSIRSIQPYYFQPKNLSKRLFQHFSLPLDHRARSRSQCRLGRGGGHAAGTDGHGRHNTCVRNVAPRWRCREMLRTLDAASSRASRLWARRLCSWGPTWTEGRFGGATLHLGDGTVEALRQVYSTTAQTQCS